MFSNPPLRKAATTSSAGILASLFPFSAASTKVLDNIPNFIKTTFTELLLLLDSLSPARINSRTSTVLASTSITFATEFANLATFIAKLSIKFSLSYPYKPHSASTRYLYSNARYAYTFSPSPVLVSLKIPPAFSQKATFFVHW